MRRHLISAMVASFAVAAPAHAATVFDAYQSFNGTNGAGNFSWISSVPAPGTPTVLSSVSSCVINNTICLGLPSGSANLPGVFKSTGVASTSHPYQPLDRLLVHPGASSALVGLFIAPSAGDYVFSIAFDNLAGGATTVSAFTNQSGSVSGIGGSFLNAVGRSYSVSGGYTLAAGEFIGISVGNAGNFSSDSTGLVFTVTQLAPISAVPEPASWAMMIFGFGLVGATMRRPQVRARRAVRA